MNWLGLCGQNPTWLLKVGCPNLTKGHIFALCEAAGEYLVCQNPGSRQMEWSEDVGRKLGTAGSPRPQQGELGVGGGGPIGQAKVLLRTGPGCQTTASFPGFTHTGHLCSDHPYRPCSVWLLTVSSTFRGNTVTNPWIDYTPLTPTGLYPIQTSILLI